MVAELTVVARDDEKTLKKKFLIYEDFVMTEEDATIKQCVEETLENFDGSPDNVRIFITMDMT